MAVRGERERFAEARPVAVLKAVAGDDAGVLLLGLAEVGEESWQVLTASGLRLVHAADGVDAVRLLRDQAAQVVIADVHQAPALIRGVRADPELSAVHVVVCAAALTKNESARASTVRIRMGVFMLTIPFVVFNRLEVSSF